MGTARSINVFHIFGIAKKLGISCHMNYAKGCDLVVDQFILNFIKKT